MPGPKDGKVQKPARSGPASKSGQRQSHKQCGLPCLQLWVILAGRMPHGTAGSSASCSSSLGLRQIPEIGRVLDYSIVNDLRKILPQQTGMRAASGPPDYAANEVPPSGFGTFSMTVVPPARWRELLVQLWPPDAGCACGLPMASGIQHEEDEAVFSISLMRRGALKRVRWLVNAIYFAERIAHFTDSGTGAERLTHRVKEIAVTRGRLLQVI